MPAAEAARLPVHIIESGPAAGVVGAQALARRIGLANVISFDMGGTTAKAGRDRERRGHPRQRVRGRRRHHGRLAPALGRRLQLKVPAIDLAEVGAGGGSLIWLDAGGALQVGPGERRRPRPARSATTAAAPQPTVTDANVVLGYLNPTPWSAARCSSMPTARAPPSPRRSPSRSA